MTAFGATQIFSGPGKLLQVSVMTSGGTTDNLAIYDAVGASGPVTNIDVTNIRAVDTKNLAIVNGLYVNLTGTGQSPTVSIYYTVG
jgi:hypothetical protein